MNGSFPFHKIVYWKIGLLYLFSQETPSISMLWERERDWDWVSRLLEGELLRELTPSLLWLRWATPSQRKKWRLSLMWKNIKATCNNSSEHTQLVFIPLGQSVPKEFLSKNYTKCKNNILIIDTLARSHTLSICVTWDRELYLLPKTDSSSPSLSPI